MSLSIVIDNTRLRLFSTAKDAQDYAHAISFQDDMWSAVAFHYGWLIRNEQGVFRDDDGIVPKNIAAIISEQLALNVALADAPLAPVTLWSRKTEKEEWEFNHLEDGHVADGVLRPTPKHDNHKSAWRKGDWLARRAFLSKDVPPRVVELPVPTPFQGQP